MVQQRFPQAILVSCVVPWDEKERFMEASFRKQIASLRASDFNHLYVFGTAGEGHAVDTARFRQVVESFYEATRGDGIHPQVGVIAQSTANFIERITIAHEIGFRIFQISLPSWHALNDTELMAFFKDVCGAFPDSKFLHYNVGRAKRILTAKDYRRLADAVPNFVATKITGTDSRLARDVMRFVPDIQHFFTETLFPVACSFGPCSLLASYGPVSPKRCMQFFDAGRNRDFDKLFTMAVEYARFTEEIFAPTGRREVTDGAYDKILARLGGHDIPMRLLSPYECYSEDICRECERIFREKFTEWSK